MLGISDEKSYQGWEIFSHGFRMRLKMILEISIILIVLQVVVFCLLMYLRVGAEGFGLMWKYPVSKLCDTLWFNPSFRFSGGKIGEYLMPDGDFGAHGIATAQAVKPIIKYIGSKTYASILLSFGIWGLFPIILGRMKVRGEKALATEHIRGMQLITVDELKKQLRNKPGVLPFGPVVLPHEWEAEQCLLAGKTRVGKTVAMMQMIQALRSKNSKAIIHDFRGELTSRFFDPTKDFLMNPLDSRSVGWNIFDDLESRMDISSICESLIPPSTGDDKFWCKAASDVLKGVMSWCYVNNKRTNRDLWNALTASTPDIIDMCNSTPAGKAGHKAIAGKEASKQAAGVLAVMMTYVSWLEFAGDGGSFSINKWLNQNEGGFIFLTGKTAIKETIKPLTGLFVELLGKKILDADEDDQRRIYFVLDEFGNMQKLPTIPDLLTGAGAKGAIFLLSIQDFAKVQRIYGRELAETILNSCGVTLTLKLKDSVTAKLFSDMLGQVQYWDSNRNYRMTPSDKADGETISRQRQTDQLVMPSEIMSLKKLEGYLMFPESNPTKIKLEIKPENNLKPSQEAFVLRPGYLLEDLVDRTENLWSDVEDLTGGAVKREIEEVTLEIDEDEQPTTTKKSLQRQDDLDLDII